VRHRAVAAQVAVPGVALPVDAPLGHAAVRHLEPLPARLPLMISAMPAKWAGLLRPQAFLTVSRQLNVEAYCLALTKVTPSGRPSAPRCRTPADPQRAVVHRRVDTDLDLRTEFGAKSFGNVVEK
jgi:hypothetical protein